MCDETHVENLTHQETADWLDAYVLFFFLHNMKITNLQDTPNT